MLLDNGCFSDKIWVWKLLLFSKKLEKKGILIDVLGRYYSVILTVLTFFWPNKVLKAGGLSWKFWKNDTGAQCFWENGRFLTKSRLESSVLFGEWTFFYKIWAWKRWFFREKSEKMGIILTFLANIIVYFVRIDVFDQIWAWQQGVFDENFEKIDIRAQRFWKNGRFFDKIWAWSSIFLDNGRFFLKIYEH